MEWQRILNPEACKNVSETTTKSILQTILEDSKRRSEESKVQLAQIHEETKRRSEERSVQWAQLYEESKRKYEESKVQLAQTLCNDGYTSFC